MPEVSTEILEQLLALDLLTLRTHTEQAGDLFTIDTQRTSLINALAISELCYVERDTRIVAYALLRPYSDACWFVCSFTTHPAFRSAPVLRHLFTQIAQILAQHKVTQLCSHVYKTNRLSSAFHRKLGFVVTNENAKAWEFRCQTAALLQQPSLQKCFV